MIVLEFKIKAKARQYKSIDEAIRTAQFIRNKCLQFWLENKGVGRYDLNKHCKVLATKYEFSRELNSMARQSAAERAWSAIAGFLNNCKKRRSLKNSQQLERTYRTNYPRFKKNVRSVEYKTTGWKLDRTTCKHLTFIDQKNIGRLKLVGTHDLHFYEDKLIRRIKLVRKANGYYCQFFVAVDSREEVLPTGKAIGLNLTNRSAYADSTGYVEPYPQFQIVAARRIVKLKRQLVKKFRKGEQSQNYQKARKKLAKIYFKLSRQREEWAKKVARCVCKSADLIAYEDLKLDRSNNKLSQLQIQQWQRLRYWIEYFGVKFGKITISIPPQQQPNYQDPSAEISPEQNKAIAILQRAIRTVGHTGTWEHSQNAWGDLPSWAIGTKPIV